MLSLNSTAPSPEKFGRRPISVVVAIIAGVVVASTCLYFITAPAHQYNVLLSNGTTTSNSGEASINGVIELDEKNSTALAPHVEEMEAKKNGSGSSNGEAMMKVLAPPMAPKKASMELDVENSPVSAPHVEELQESEDVRLDRVLKEASMSDKTVILTTLNSAWSEPGSVIDLFLESFKNGDGTPQLLNHLIIVSLDTQAYLYCKAIHKHCFALKTEGVDFSGDKFFMTEGYLLMMWRRIDFLRIVLEKGYNFIFSDGDIMWFRNPFSQFYPDADFQIACDNFYGDPSSTRNRPNGGFTYVKANNKSIAFYKFWYSSRQTYPKLHDQDVLNKIKEDPYITQVVGLNMKFLSTEYFGGFCEPSKDLNKVCTMHANCCVGLETKIHDLKVLLEDWRNFVKKPQDKRSSGRYSWSFLSIYCI